MSNLMSLKNIKNNPHRDAFDLSRKFAFTAKLGELLPVLCEDVMPGDKFQIRTDWFTRTQPVASPAFTRFSEYYDFFFVPYHLLWRHFPQFVIQTDDNNWATSIYAGNVKFNTHPYLSRKNVQSFIQSSYTISNNKLTDKVVQENGLSVAYGATKLLEYLGYGQFYTKTVEYSTYPNPRGAYSIALDTDEGKNNPAMNPFPLAAYQKIYNDFYRFKQWQTPSPWSYNFDYLQSNNMQVVLPSSYSSSNEPAYRSGLLTLRSCNYNKDYFTGRLPEKQYGVSAIAAPLLNPDGSLPEFSTLYSYSSSTAGGSTNTSIGTLLGKSKAGDPSSSSNAAVSLNNLGISALAVRQAEFLQKWKEITNSGGTDYVSQIEKHFGVTPPKADAHLCTYLGGFDKKFGIDEVTNTNLQNDAETILRGKGINGGNGFVEFDVKEHGIIMCIYHVSLLPEYTTMIANRMNLKTKASDYVIPELDNIGMQGISPYEYNGLLRGVNYTDEEIANVGSTFLGYVPRYSEYKTAVDKVGGAFSKTLKYWCTPLNTYDQKYVMYGTNNLHFWIYPGILNGVFNIEADSTVDSDQFLVNSNFEVRAVRNISRDGLPY